MKKEILFITGNDNKFREFQEILKTLELRREKINLPELQGTPEEIVKEKAKLACKITKEACFVDDTSLCFDAWNGLPGPYIKDFLKNIGVDNLPNILLKSSDNTKAKAITSIGYCEPGKEPVCIQGITEGRISLPKGDKNFKKGWDQIFIPDGMDRTYAEMESAEKHSFSQRQKAIRAFEEFLDNN
jgi:inosine triphosphate pyrophosphatase